MITRLDRKRLPTMPKAVKNDGVMLCPYCWHVLAEPIDGTARVAIWCRTCKRHVLLEIDEPLSR